MVYFRRIRYRLSTDVNADKAQTYLWGAKHKDVQFCMIETATLNKGTIFAQDKNGECLVVGDKVMYNRKHYRVQSLEWDVSGDGLYHETAEFSGANLTGASFAGAKISNSNFSGSTITGGQLNEVDFLYVSPPWVRDPRFVGTKQMVSNVDLSSVNLAGFNTAGKTFSNVNFANSSISLEQVVASEEIYGANLQGTGITRQALEEALSAAGKSGDKFDLNNVSF